MAGEGIDRRTLPGGGSGGLRRGIEPGLAVLLGAVPSLVALSSGGQEWQHRLILFLAMGMIGLLAVVLLPSSAWHLHVADKVLLVGALCLGLFLLALDMSGMVVALGAQGEEVVFRRSGWAGLVVFLTCICYGLCVWIGQILVRRFDSGREWIAGSAMVFALLYCVARVAWTAAGHRFPGIGNDGFVNRNAFAQFALLHASLALGLLYGKGAEGSARARVLRFGLLGSAGVFALVAAATTSRGGMASFAIVLAAWLFLVRRNLASRGGLVSVLATLVVVSAAAWFGPEVLQRFQQEHLSFATRLLVWKKSLGLSLESPMFGFGPGNFADAFNSRFDLGTEKIFTHAEQSYLTFAIEFGWVLLGIVACWLIWNLWQAWRLRRESWRTFCAVTLPLGLFLVHGMVESLWRFPAIVVVVALVLAMNRGRSTLPNRGMRRPSAGPWNMLALSGSLLLLAGAFYGHLIHRACRNAERALDAGLTSTAKEATAQVLHGSLDERLWLGRLGRRWTRYLERTGVQDEQLESLVRSIGDELIRRHPSHWESWLTWLWPRLHAIAPVPDSEIVFGVRKTLNCLSHWTRLYRRIFVDLSRYAPQALGPVFQSLPESQRVVLWDSMSREIRGMNRPFLEWAARQPMPPEVEAEVLRACSNLQESEQVTEGLMKAWQNPQVSWPERRAVGERLIKTLGPKAWFEQFPPDLKDDFEAQLYRLNRGIQHQLWDQVKEQLRVIKMPATVSDRRLLVQFTELHVSAGLFDRAREICGVLLAGSLTARNAQERIHAIENEYVKRDLDPRAATELLFQKARVTAAQGSWLDLIAYLIRQKEFPQAASALRQFPVVQQQEDERKEYLLYKAQVDEGGGHLEQALRTYVQLLYLEVPH